MEWNRHNRWNPGTSGAVSFHVGANASQTVSHTFADIEVANAGDGNAHTGVATDNSGNPTVQTMVFGGGTGTKTLQLVIQ